MGTDVNAVWQRLLRGESGVARTTIFDATNFPTQIAAEVKDNWSVSEVGEDPEQWKYAADTRALPLVLGQSFSRFWPQRSNYDPTRFGCTWAVAKDNRTFSCSLA